MLNSDRVAAILMLLVALVFGTQMGNLTNFGMVFPKAVIIVLGVLSAALLVKSWTGRGGGEVVDVRGMRAVGLAAALMVAWVSLIPHLGFYVSSVLACLLMMLLVDGVARKPGTLMTSLVIIAVEVGVFYLVFAKLLVVPLPEGILF
ncbi:MAG: tripartite tricarboxylate transporter TctB family protein [Bacteroidota bacterium]